VGAGIAPPLLTIQRYFCFDRDFSAIPLLPAILAPVALSFLYRESFRPFYPEISREMPGHPTIADKDPKPDRIACGARPRARYLLQMAASAISMESAPNGEYR